jgi:hypothetical protein
LPLDGWMYQTVLTVTQFSVRDLYIVNVYESLHHPAVTVYTCRMAYDVDTPTVKLIQWAGLIGEQP